MQLVLIISYIIKLEVQNYSYLCFMSLSVSICFQYATLHQQISPTSQWQQQRQVFSSFSLTLTALCSTRSPFYYPGEGSASVLNKLFSWQKKSKMAHLGDAFKEFAQKCCCFHSRLIGKSNSHGQTWCH